MGHSSKLSAQHCRPCNGGTPLPAAEAQRLLAELDGWALQEQAIAKSYEFVNHYQLLAFVNAVAWLSHREDHHPEMTLGYNKCRITYSTHAVGGLSENDFICAAKVDALFQL